MRARIRYSNDCGFDCGFRHLGNSVLARRHPSARVPRANHQHISETHQDSKCPSSGTITTDRCITHIRDVANSKRRAYLLSAARASSRLPCLLSVFLVSFCFLRVLFLDGTEKTNAIMPTKPVASHHLNVTVKTHTAPTQRESPKYHIPLNISIPHTSNLQNTILCGQVLPI